ncbi:JmjC domain-containing protein [Variovorax sp. PBL-E5]|uniref:JmjC domain-containing protein n=1 Tax=Variovorax sp. PBL-E5 TaxID=434014 RepID=UPI0013185ED9|nr:cupin domain-containing protein [Variovorax sp. PBL-E5]VTU27407.1 hypothetical protein E5CHR_02396 [Variovorax sp. PBL-E5]
MRMDENSTVATAQARPACRVWADDAQAFTTLAIGRLHHNFHEHPLLQLDELERLAHDLVPLRQCRFVKPGITQASNFHHDPTHPDGLGIDEVFRRIQEAGSWVALYNVESIPRYQALLTEILDTVRPMIRRDQGRTFLETGFIFISAPPSVTPFHIDRENNFWLQLHGRKTMNVWPHTDRVTVAADVVEDYIVAHNASKVKFKEELRARSHEFDVGPGDGVYFPSTSPHTTRSERDWVRPGDGVSVSFGVNFYTDATRRTARVHQVNRLLRRSLGMAPTYPGMSRPIDALKAPLGQLIGVSRQMAKTVLAPLRGRSALPPPPGSY